MQYKKLIIQDHSKIFGRNAFFILYNWDQVYLASRILRKWNLASDVKSVDTLALDVLIELISGELHN